MFIFTKKNTDTITITDASVALKEEVSKLTDEISGLKDVNDINFNMLV